MVNEQIVINAFTSNYSVASFSLNKLNEQHEIVKQFLEELKQEILHKENNIKNDFGQEGW